MHAHRGTQAIPWGLIQLYTCYILETLFGAAGEGQGGRM